MNHRRFVMAWRSVLFIGLIAGMSQPTSGQCPGAQCRTISFDRSDLVAAPCGPDYLRGPLRGLIPQGFMGADFRPACRFHDECYTVPGTGRLYCDREFQRRMDHACSRSACPLGCRLVNRMMYTSSRLFGARGYSEGQRIGRSRMPVICGY